MENSKIWFQICSCLNLSHGQSCHIPYFHIKFKLQILRTKSYSIVFGNKYVIIVQEMINGKEATKIANKHGVKLEWNIVYKRKIIQANVNGGVFFFVGHALWKLELFHNKFITSSKCVDI